MDTHKKFITTILTIMILFISSIPAHSSNRINSSITDYSINTTNVYGYIIQVNSSQNNTVQKEIACLVNQLFEDNATVCWLKSDMTLLAKGLNDSDPVEPMVFERGSFIVGYTGNHSIDVNITCTIFNYCLTYNCPVYKLMESILDLEAYVLKKPRVAIYDGKAVNQYSYYRSLEEAGFRHVFFITKDDILKDLTNDNYDIIMWGGQAGQFSDVINDNFNEKGMEVNNKINSFVKSGGGYIGSCYGAYKASSETRLIPGLPMGYFGFKINDKYKVHLIDDPVFRALPGGCGYTCDGLYGSDTTNGLSVRIVNPDCPVSFGLPEIIPKNEYIGGPMFLKKIFGNSNTESLAVIEKVDLEQWNKDAMMSYIFPVWRITPEWQKDRIVKRWVDFSIGKALWVTANYGKGKVVAFGSHPEFYGFENDRNPQRVIYNSVFYICSELQSNIDLENFVSFSKIHAEINRLGKVPETRDIDFSANVSNCTDPCSYCWIVNGLYDGPYVFDLNFTGFLMGNGNKLMVFCVIDADGFADYDYSWIEIAEKIKIEPSQKLYYGFSNEPLNFSANVSNGFKPFTYEWDFDDGSSSNEAEPSHIYLYPGFYRIWVDVFDSIGDADSQYANVIINDRYPAFNVSLDIEEVSRNTTHVDYLFTVNVSKTGKYIYDFCFDKYIFYSSSWIEGDSFSVVCSFRFEKIYRFWERLVIIVNSNQSKSYCLIKNFKINLPPTKPLFDDIKESYIAGIKSYFSFYFYETEYENVSVIIDYGDGYIDDNNETVVKIEKHNNGCYAFYAEHVWDKLGKYKVRVQGVDENGHKGKWSEPYTVKVRRLTLLDIIISLLSGKRGSDSHYE